MKCTVEIFPLQKTIPKPTSIVKMRCAFCNECSLMKHIGTGCIHLTPVFMDNVRLPTRCAIKPKDTVYGINATKAHWKWAEVELSETGELLKITEIKEE